MVKNTQRDNVWIAALREDEFTKHDIIESVDAGSRTVHDVLKTMVDADLLTETDDRRRVDRGDSYMWSNVTVYMSPEAESSDSNTRESTEPDISDIDEDTVDRLTEEIGVSNGDVSVQTHDETDDKPDTPASDVVETIESDARYIIECPECNKTLTREKNSKLVKDVREKKRFCTDCNSPLELPKDDRPNPPTCPECDEEIICIDEKDGHTSYIHDVEITSVGGQGFRETDACYTSD